LNQGFPTISPTIELPTIDVMDPHAITRFLDTVLAFPLARFLPN